MEKSNESSSEQSLSTNNNQSTKGDKVMTTAPITKQEIIETVTNGSNVVGNVYKEGIPADNSSDLDSAKKEMGNYQEDNNAEQSDDSPKVEIVKSEEETKKIEKQIEVAFTKNGEYSLEETKERISTCLGKVRDGYIELGEELKRIKSEVLQVIDSGKGKKNVSSWQHFCEKYLPFDYSHAQKLVKIASDPRLKNPKVKALLPDAMSTMHKISTMSNDDFDKAVDEGIINQNVTLKDVNQFLNPEDDKKDADKKDTNSCNDLLKDGYELFTVLAKNEFKSKFLNNQNYSQDFMNTIESWKDSGLTIVLTENYQSLTAHKDDPTVELSEDIQTVAKGFTGSKYAVY